MGDNLTLASILKPHNANKVLFKPSNNKAKCSANKKSRLNCQRLVKGTSEQQLIAEHCTDCTRRKPCGQACCAKCLFWAQQVIGEFFAPDLVRLLRKATAAALDTDQPMPVAWVFSVVDEEMASQRDHLSVEAIDAKNKAIHAALDASPLGHVPSLYGLDISLNALIGSRPLWQPQYYGITFAPDKNVIRDCLSSLFPQTGGRWRKPLIIKHLPENDFPMGARYVLKPNIVRRESYVGTNGRRQTAKRDLKANEEVEIAVFLQKLGIHRRLQLRGLEIANGQMKRIRSAKRVT